MVILSTSGLIDKCKWEPTGEMRIDIEETSGEYSFSQLSPHSYAFQVTTLHDTVPDTRQTVVAMIHSLGSGRLQFKRLYFNYRRQCYLSWNRTPFSRHLANEKKKKEFCILTLSVVWHLEGYHRCSDTMTLKHSWTSAQHGNLLVSNRTRFQPRPIKSE